MNIEKANEAKLLKDLGASVPTNKTSEPISSLSEKDWIPCHSGVFPSEERLVDCTIKRLSDNYIWTQNLIYLPNDGSWKWTDYPEDSYVDTNDFEIMAWCNTRTPYTPQRKMFSTETIDFERILKEKLGEDAYQLLSSSEKEFSEWIDRGQWTVRKCDKLARKNEELLKELHRVNTERSPSMIHYI